MRSVFLMTLSVCLASGCTWQDTLTEVGAAPGYLRLSPVHEVVDPPRWRLSTDAAVRVTAASSAPQLWMDAAGAGVGRVFQSGPASGAYMLEVQWPVVETARHLPDAGSSSRVRAGLLGVIEMPRLPASGELNIAVRDAHGRHLHRLALRIKPELWGKAWTEPSHIEAAFTHLANHLRGG